MAQHPLADGRMVFARHLPGPDGGSYELAVAELVEGDWVRDGETVTWPALMIRGRMDILAVKIPHTIRTLNAQVSLSRELFCLSSGSFEQLLAKAEKEPKRKRFPTKRQRRTVAVTDEEWTSIEPLIRAKLNRSRGD